MNTALQLFSVWNASQLAGELAVVFSYKYLHRVGSCSIWKGRHCFCSSFLLMWLANGRHNFGRIWNTVFIMFSWLPSLLFSPFPQWLLLLMSVCIFTSELKQKYGGSPHSPPSPNTASLVSRIPYQCDIVVIINEPALIHYQPKSAVYSIVHSLCYRLYGLE